MAAPWDHIGPKQTRASLEQCLQRPNVLIDVGMLSHCPPVRFPDGARWLPQADLEVRLSPRAGWHNGATGWWNHSDLFWAALGESTPSSQSQFMPRKIPQLINFSGATVTSCGLILSVRYVEMFIPVSFALAWVETSSLNSNGIHGCLLSTSLDLTVKYLVDGRRAYKVLCQGLTLKFS